MYKDVKVEQSRKSTTRRLETKEEKSRGNEIAVSLITISVILRYCQYCMQYYVSNKYNPLPPYILFKIKCYCCSTVVPRRYCCSVVTVNNKNSVQPLGINAFRDDSSDGSPCREGERGAARPPGGPACRCARACGCVSASERGRPAVSTGAEERGARRVSSESLMAMLPRP